MNKSHIVSLTHIDLGVTVLRQEIAAHVIWLKCQSIIEVKTPWMGRQTHTGVWIPIPVGIRKCCRKSSVKQIWNTTEQPAGSPRLSKDSTCLLHGGHSHCCGKTDSGVTLFDGYGFSSSITVFFQLHQPYVNPRWRHCILPTSSRACQSVKKGTFVHLQRPLSSDMKINMSFKPDYHYYHFFFLFCFC